MKFRAGKKQTLSVVQFFDECPSELGLRISNGESFGGEKMILSPWVQHLGLALAGYPDYLTSGTIQVLGSSEISFLETQTPAQRKKAIDGLPYDLITSFLVTNDLRPPRILLDKANSANIPVFSTSLETSFAIATVSKFLEKRLAERTTIHGVFIGMYDLGVLILGESGIGKSECALDLILRGHRLIADDSVMISKIGGDLEADSAELTKEFLEIRGLGLINLKDLFGVFAIGSGRRIDLCVKLIGGENPGDIDRLGMKLTKTKILGCDVPGFTLPVSPGRNLSTLVETAVRIYLLKASGKHSARELIEKYNAAVSGNI